MRDLESTGSVKGLPPFSIWESCALSRHLSSPAYRVEVAEIGRDALDDPHTTNMAFGGADKKTPFITESGSGSILTAQLDVPGKPMFSHQ